MAACRLALFVCAGLCCVAGRGVLGQAVPPSSCLSALIRDSSPDHCCTPQPFLEIGFFIRFGCTTPLSALDQGVRLHARVNKTNFPVMYYTPSVAVPTGSNNPRVRQVNATHVNADNLGGNSSLPFRVLPANQSVYIREYICDSNFFSDDFGLRFLQLYDSEGGSAQEDEATWSIDNVTVTLWLNHSCSASVVAEDFSTDTVFDEFKVKGGEVVEPPCGETASGTALYFHLPSVSRSIKMFNLNVTTADLQCSPEPAPAGEGCPASCESAAPVCSIGSLQCACLHGQQSLGTVCPANTCYGSPECDGELISVGVGLESCCLTDGAYSFHNGSQCFLCNVYGWEVSTLRLAEAGPPVVASLLLKGEATPGTVVRFRVTHSPENATAGEDYLPPDPTTLFSTGEAVPITVNADTISQEGTEVFSLTLTADGQTPENFFFKNTLRVSISDSTVVQVQFSAASYSAVESDPALLTTVETNATLATPLVLSVTPLSYAEAGGRGLPLPLVRPPPANSTDFAGGMLTVEVPAGLAPGSVVVGEIPLLDDVIAEPDEEGFVAVLGLLVGGALEPALVSLGPPTLGLISDDDHSEEAVEVGFTTSRNYRAVEGGKAVRVCVGVRVGRVESLLAPVRLRLTTVPGSASPIEGFATNLPVSAATPVEDFVPLSTELSISADAPTRCVEITITNDDVAETPIEVFAVSLLLISPAPLQPHVSLQSRVALVGIVDDEALDRMVDDVTSQVSKQEPGEASQQLANLLDLLLATGQPASQQFSQKFLTAVSEVFTVLEAGPDPTQVDGSSRDGGKVATKLLQGLDTFALKAFDPAQAPPTVAGLLLSAQLLERGSLPEAPLMGIRASGSEITLPPQVTSMSDSDQVRIASFYFENLTGILPDAMLATNESLLLASPVISATVGCEDAACTISLPEASDPVRIVLTHTEKGLNASASCVFWEILTDNTAAGGGGGDGPAGRWSTDGCRVVESNSTVTVCECYHLTHFAILLSPGLEISEEDAFRLQIIGYVGVSISLLCLVLAVLALLCLKSLWGMRNYIHVNLCISLFVAQLTFIVGVDKTANQAGCQAVAVLLHYFFLVTFMWMLMEGVVLYVALVRVFIKKQKLYIAAFTIASYGLPALYMCVTVPLGLVLKDEEGVPHYGGESCWLRYDTNFIWAFIAPVLLIIFINIGFFIMAICIMYKHEKRQARQSKTQAFAHWLKSSISLLVIMGITWIIGVLAFTQALLAVAYIFTIFVAFQGALIFILFIPVSKQVRDSYKKWWRGKVAESKFLSKHFSSGGSLERQLTRFSSLRSTSRVSKYNSSLHEDAAKTKEQEAFSYNGIQLGSFDPPPDRDAPSPPPITGPPSPPPSPPPTPPPLSPSFSNILEPPSDGMQFNIAFLTTPATCDDAQLEQQTGSTTPQASGEETS